MKLSALFTPVQVGNMQVPNRFVMPPMGNNFAHENGSLSQRSLEYYRTRAEGGFGLLTIEATVVAPGSRAGRYKPCLLSDDTTDSFRRVAEACHAYGAKVSVQLQHAGPEGNAAVAGAPLRAASAVPAACGKAVPVPLSVEEIHALAEHYGDAARRAEQAGLDAVELHCAHGYLLHSFLSPRTNHRTDEFGGCLDNRLRIVRMILENIRKKTSDRLAVLCRINGCDDLPGGLSVFDSAVIARSLQEMGVDGLHISRAVHLRDDRMWAPTATPGGFSADIVTEIKRAVSIPVITVGRFTDPSYAALLVEQGRADLVAFGRQSITDPAMPRKVRQGCMDEVVPCIACLQGCVGNLHAGKPITCLANPSVGRESELRPAPVRRRVLVAGGGVAGLLAARVCAQRGHSVLLCEAQESVGGQMRLAAVPPGKGAIAGMLRAYRAECERAGVEIRCGTPVTESLLRQENPDFLLLATGAKPSLPPVPGLAESGAVFAADVLAGNVSCGERVLVLGGGLVGCETAHFLAERRHDVTLLDRREQFAPEMVEEHRRLLQEDFAAYGVACVLGASAERVFPDGVLYRDRNGETRTLAGFDQLVLAFGAEPFCPLEETAQRLGIPYAVLGDAHTPGKALDATRQAWEVATQWGESP